MIQNLTAGFMESAKSPRTVVATAIYGALLLIKIPETVSRGGENAWDVVLPVLSDPLWITLVLMGWLMSWIVPMAVASARSLELIRFGSPGRLIRSRLAYLTGALSALVLYATACFVGIGNQLGYSANWGGASTSYAGNVESAYSAAHFAQWFSSPLSAVLASVTYSVIGILSIAYLILTLALTKHVTTAIYVASATTLWLLITSFSPFEIPPVLDGSFLVSLGWALSIPGGIAIGFGWWLILWLSSTILIMSSYGRLHFRSLLTERWWVMMMGLGLASMACANFVLQRPQSLAEFLSLFFAGSQTDLISYLLVASIPLTFSTGWLSRLDELNNGTFTMQALRFGSYRRWFRSNLLIEVSWAGVLVAAVSGIVLTIGISSTGGKAAEILIPFSLGVASFFAVICLQIVLALTVHRLVSNIISFWAGLMGLLLVIGYWFPSASALVGLVVPYSNFQDDSLSGQILLNVFGTIAITGLLLLIVQSRTLTKYGNLLAQGWAR